MTFKTPAEREAEFRRDLAELLARHEAELEITDDGKPYGLHRAIGVVSMAERFDGRNVTEESFEAMVGHVMKMIEPFESKHRMADHIANGRVHLLGTSGTVTTVAGILLGLPRYDRNRVDGCWLNSADIGAVTDRLLHASYEQRAANPCIGRERADLVLAGCAILEEIRLAFPAERIRVADRGLREGILTLLMKQDGTYGRAA